MAYGKFNEYRQPHPWKKKNPIGPKPGVSSGAPTGGRKPWMDDIEREFGPMNGPRGGAGGGDPMGMGRIRKNSEDTVRGGLNRPPGSGLNPNSVGQPMGRGPRFAAEFAPESVGRGGMRQRPPEGIEDQAPGLRPRPRPRRRPTMSSNSSMSGGVRGSR